MFIFILVQSGTDVDTVQSALEGLTNSRHLLKSHNEDSWLTCHICQKNFSHRDNLKKHVRRHRAVKPYVCSDCSKRFCTAGELNNHVLVLSACHFLHTFCRPGHY